MAAWEDGVYALLQGLPRREHMDIDRETWRSGDFDRINAVIRERYRHWPLEDVLKMLRDVHQRLVEKIEALTDEDLQRPYRHFQPHSTREEPVIGWIIGSTYEHYAEHRPWIAAIVGEA